MKRLNLFVVALAALFTVLAPTIAISAPSQADLAERLRLREAMEKHAQKGQWNGVESKYQAILDLNKKVSICARIYWTAAAAAREEGSSSKMLTRIWGASLRNQTVPADCSPVTDPTAFAAEIKSWLEAEEASLGYVKIKGKKGMKITWKEAPFDPSIQSSGRAVFAEVESKGKFSGLMPVGEYKVEGGSDFTVSNTNWAASKKCAKGKLKEQRPKFSKCFKKAKAQQFNLKSSGKKKFKFRMPWQKK